MGRPANDIRRSPYRTDVDRHSTVVSPRKKAVSVMSNPGLSRRTLITSTAVAGAAAAASTLVTPGPAEAAPAVEAPVTAKSNGGIPTPEQYFGFEIGSDGNLAQWTPMVKYFQLIAER